jgi:hypothetical protein
MASIVSSYPLVDGNERFGWLVAHAYHCGELSQTLDIHGLPQVDLWRPD